jgi:hypothetical protein
MALGDSREEFTVDLGSPEQTQPVEMTLNLSQRPVMGGQEATTWEWEGEWVIIFRIPHAAMRRPARVSHEISDLPIHAEEPIQVGSRLYELARRERFFGGLCRAIPFHPGDARCMRPAVFREQ